MVQYSNFNKLIEDRDHFTCAKQSASTNDWYSKSLMSRGIIILLLLVLFSSCNNNNRDDFCCGLTYSWGKMRPKVIEPPIDWENHNDMGAIVMNFSRCCCDQDWMRSISDGKYIKTSGWIHQEYVSPTLFRLTSNRDNIFASMPSVGDYWISIWVADDVSGAIAAKIASADITSKFYVRGNLFFWHASGEKYCVPIFGLWVSNADDVYLE